MLCLILLYCTMSSRCLSICQFFLRDKSNHIFYATSFLVRHRRRRYSSSPLLLNDRRANVFFLYRKTDREKEEKRNEEKYPCQVCMFDALC